MSAHPFQIVSLDHVVLRVRDLDAAFAFYVDVLGCSLERELPELGLYQLRAGAQLIDLVPVDSKLGGGTEVRQENRNVDHICLVISSFDETALQAHLAAHGFEASPAAERYGAKGYGQSVYVTDPDGNTVELKENN